MPVGTINLFHDSVPIEDVRSTGFYVFYLFLATWSGAVLIFALYYISESITFTRKEGYHGYVIIMVVVAALEGVIACGLRLVRHLVSPLQTSPRLASFPDGVLARFLTQLPNLPSALSTLLISLEFFRVIAVGPLPPRQMVMYFGFVMATLATVFAIGLWQISDSCTLLTRQLNDLAVLVQAGTARPADFTRVAAENSSSVRDVIWAINGILFSALGLFTLAGLYSIVKVVQAAQSGSAAVRKSAGGLFIFIAIEFFFSLPVVINMTFHANDDRLQWRDYTNGTWVWDALAQASELVVSTAQMLQIDRQLKRFITNADNSRFASEQYNSSTARASESAAGWRPRLGSVFGGRRSTAAEGKRGSAKAGGSLNQVSPVACPSANTDAMEGRMKDTELKVADVSDQTNTFQV